MDVHAYACMCLHTILLQVLHSGQGLSTRPIQQSRVKLRTSGVLEGSGGTVVVDRHIAVSFTVGDGDVIQGTHPPTLTVMMSYRYLYHVA